MAEIRIHDIPLDGGGWEFDPDRLEGHAPMFWQDLTHSVLVIRPYGYWYTEGEVGDVCGTLDASDINCIEALWPNDGKDHPTEIVEVVISLDRVVEALCENFAHPLYASDNCKVYLVEWAEHLEGLARTIRDKLAALEQG